MKKTVGALVGVVACGPLLLALPVVIVGAGNASATPASCPPGGGPQGVDSSAVAAQVESLLKGSSPLSAPSVAGLDKPNEQVPNAKTIQATGVAMHIPVHGQIVALATALQESGLRNANGGDRDSLGLFQQRPSQGWGTAAQIMQPVYASTKFYEALNQVSGWQSMTVTQAAQAVQRSGYPDAYAKWEPLATALQKAIEPLLAPAGTASPPPGGSPTPAPSPPAGATASPSPGTGSCGTSTTGGDGTDFGTIPAGSLPAGYAIPAGRAAAGPDRDPLGAGPVGHPVPVGRVVRERARAGPHGPLRLLLADADGLQGRRRLPGADHLRPGQAGYRRVDGRAQAR